MLNLKFNDSTEVFDIEFSQISENIVQIKGDIPQNESGFVLSRPGKTDNWNYSDYTTIYRVPQNGVVQFSNDGSVYIPPKKDVTVSATWNDGDNMMDVRPDRVSVKVLVNGKKKTTVTLNEDNGWSYTISDVIADDVYTIEAEQFADYEMTINGTSVIYSMDIPQPEELTIDDLAEAIAELGDAIVQNSTDIISTQEAVAEIYEMITPAEEV